MENNLQYEVRFVIDAEDLKDICEVCHEIKQLLSDNNIKCYYEVNDEPLEDEE